jgi:DGQHR domain-containing protein
VATAHQKKGTGGAKAADLSKKSLSVAAIEVQSTPPVYLASLPGPWLLEHTTPSWRSKDPKKGFQRIVKEARARQIALTILDPGRPFPNAIVLATDIRSLERPSEGMITLPAKTKLLVVDGQHRLWAQQFSDEVGRYPAVIHLGKTEVEMAKLFLEINDNQRRVPSSLRWDLVRLVRDGQPNRIMASDIVYELATREDSPFYIALDLTGEDKDISIKQGSLAPEIELLVSRSKRKKWDVDFDEYLNLLINFFTALRSLDPDWGDSSSTFYKARVLRAMIRVLSDMVISKMGKVEDLDTETLSKYLGKIDAESLDADTVKAAQGTFGVNQLYEIIKEQIFPL